MLVFLANTRAEKTIRIGKNQNGSELHHGYTKLPSKEQKQKKKKGTTIEKYLMYNSKLNAKCLGVKTD